MGPLLIKAVRILLLDRVKNTEKESKHSYDGVMFIVLSILKENWQ